MEMLFALTGCSTTPKPCKLLGCGSGQLIGGRHRFEKKKKKERDSTLETSGTA
jgi:hypothetical protein